ncbi:hypothetical protein DFH09DRAFT_1191990 [Mycena vulgaris]|nr:hypothetical protein DFH09DRAFT_1191990 [Mycena vulgaris]
MTTSAFVTVAAFTTFAPENSTSFTSFPQPTQAAVTSFTPSSQPASAVPTVFVTETTVVGSSPSSSVANTTGAQSSGISAGAVAGISLGLGLFVGLVAATLFYFCRRPRTSKNGDGEALLGHQRREEKLLRAATYVPPPAPIPHARILDWVQRTRAVSMSTISSNFSPTVVPESESESTLIRAQSVVSSRSAYSQASAPHGSRTSLDRTEVEGPSRPPHLYRISEYAE